MNAAHAPIFDFLVHIMLVRRSKTLIFLYFQKLRYLTSAFDRPGFQRMIADIEKGRINLVITKDLSRLGRNYIMCGQYTEIYFPERHVRYIALNDGVDTLNQTSSMDITPFKHILKNKHHSLDENTSFPSFRRNRRQFHPQLVQGLCPAALDGASGQADDPADFLVRHVQDTAQNQDALVLPRQAGERLSYQLIANTQIASVGAEHKAVAEVVVCGAELVQFFPRNSIERKLMLPLAAKTSHIALGLISQNRLAESVKAAPLVTVAGDFHLLTPFRRGIRWFSPFPLSRHRRCCLLPAKRLLF